MRLLLCILLIIVSSAISDDVVDSVVNFSDSTELSGKLSLTPGRRLIVVAKDKRYEFALPEIKRIQFVVIAKRLEYKWHFAQEGKVQKEKSKVPYPLKELAVEITLNNGKVISGNLQTTVFYLSSASQNKRLIYRSKLKGSEGETLESLIHLSTIEISHTDEAGKRPVSDFIRLVSAKSFDLDTARYINYPALNVIDIQKNGESFVVDRDSINKGILCWQQDHEVHCFYPRSAIVVNKALVSKVSKAVNDARDFFDLKEVLQVYHPESGQEIFVFLKLSRGRRSTYTAKANIPWQLNIWRFKMDAEIDGQIMIAGRFVLARGIVKSLEDIPPMLLKSFDPDKVLKDGCLKLE